jgi:hypothetical protein
MIAEKVSDEIAGDILKDDPAEVHHFFERWHWDSLNYISHRNL